MAGAFHAHLSRDDLPVSRLSRYGVEATIRSLEYLSAKGLLDAGRDWKLSGHYQLFDSADDERRMQEALAVRQFPTEQVRWVHRDEVAQDLGVKPVNNALYFARAGWVNPSAWCRAMLADVEGKASGSVTLQLSSDIRRLEKSPDGTACAVHWHDLRDSGDLLQQRSFDRLVIAAALDSLELWPQGKTIARGVKGQVSYWRTDRQLPRVISGAAYAISHSDTAWLIGATFDRTALDDTVTDSGHTWNTERLTAAFGHLPAGEIIGGRSAIRAMWPDRLPAIGPAVDGSGMADPVIWFASGYGSRGLTWAALGAELLSALMGGQTPPLPQDLAAAVLPGRFFSRASNSKPTLPSLPKTR